MSWELAVGYRKRNELYYSGKLRQWGQGDPRALGWASEENQIVRFEQFVKLFDFEGKSVLDVGCGWGSFAQFLRNKGITVASYHGVDLLEFDWDPELGTFQHGDFLEIKPPTVDIAILSGVFNLPVDNWEYVTSITLGKMITCSIEGIVFNMEAHQLFPARDRNRWYKWAKSMGRAVVVSGYLENDYTIAIHT